MSVDKCDITILKLQSWEAIPSAGPSRTEQHPACNEGSQKGSYASKVSPPLTA